MIKHRGLILLALLAVLSGCGEKRVLERLGFIQIVGYDSTSEGKLKVSYYLPKFGTEFGKTQGEYLTATVRSSKEAKMAITRQTNWDLVSGQLRNVLLEDSLARQGIWHSIDTLVRDPTISPRVKLSIVEGATSDLLQKSYQQHPSTSKYLDRLLEKEIREQAIPRISLFEFEREYFDDGIDPIMPVLKDKGKNLEITGLGLFHGDKYVGKIDADDIPIYSIIQGSTKKLDMYLPLEGGRQGPSYALLESVKSTRKIRVKRNSSGQFEVEIRIKAKSSISEYKGDFRIDIEQQRKQLERKIADRIMKRAETLVSYMQKKHADGLGIGAYARNSMTYRAWKQLNWAEEYPEVKVSCKVKFTIMDYGKLQ